MTSDFLKCSRGRSEDTNVSPIYLQTLKVTAVLTFAYTVRSGDTMWKIAEKMYSSGGKHMKIFESNAPLLEIPDKILPGQELVIPEHEAE